MAADERVICDSAALAEGGRGVRFALAGGEGAATGFAIRHDATVRAFVNRCPHMGTELDWQPGEFFEATGLYLVCATHGALFQPATGFCVAGPCRGASLEALRTREENGRVLLLNEPDDTP
jgi:nitrite reductase/ring-hydroxylating ferredoxin subunit